VKSGGSNEASSKEGMMRQGWRFQFFFDEILVVSEHLGVFIPLPVRRFYAKFSGRKLGGEDQQLPDLGKFFA
jgi:hypothetical protein